MEKFIVVANFTCHDTCEDDLYTSQWLVGTFDKVEDCIEASRKDLGRVAQDHFECVLCEEEFESEKEYYDAIAENVANYCSDRWEAMIGGIEVELNTSNSVETMSNDFIDSEFTDQRQIVKYYIHKI